MRGTWNVVILCALIPFVFDNLVSARVCVIGTEPGDGKVRFVLPAGDPCSCTELILGGHNAYAQPRNGPPVYMDTLPMDAEGLRRNLGCARSTRASLECPPYADCQEVMDAGYTTSGVYIIIHKEEHVEVYCDMETPDHGYMVFQRRINGSVDFNRTWSEYEAGFGDVQGEFWWGNKKLRSFTESTGEWELAVDLEMSRGDIHVRLAEFNVTGPMYVVRFGSSIDSYDNVLASSNNGAFSTRDRLDAELSPECVAQIPEGGWWYGKCQDLDCNLNGVYVNGAEMEGSAAGLQCQREQVTGSKMKMRRKGVQMNSDSDVLVTQGDYEDQNNNNDRSDNNNDQGDNNNDQGDNNNDQGDDNNNNNQSGNNNDQGDDNNQGDNQQ